MTNSIITLVRLPQITIYVRSKTLGQEIIAIITFLVKCAFKLIRTITPLILYFLQNIYRGLYVSITIFNTPRKCISWLGMEKKKRFSIRHKSLKIIRVLLPIYCQFCRLYLKYRPAPGKVD